MAWRNMLSTEKVEQKGTETIHYTFRCYPSCKKAGKPIIPEPKVTNEKFMVSPQNTRLHCSIEIILTKKTMTHEKSQPTSAHAATLTFIYIYNNQYFSNSWNTIACRLLSSWCNILIHI